MSHRNPFGRSAFEQAEYRRYFYTDTGALRNKADIRNPIELEILERRVTAERAREGLPENSKKPTYEGFRAIHRHLFQDLYGWAGQERTYTTGRNENLPFARPEFITSCMEDQFKKVKEQNYLKDLSKDEFANSAAAIVNEINAIHPFIDGNGRVQRHWLRLTAEQAGHKLIFWSVDRKQWNEASKIGFERLDHGPMAKLLCSRLNTGRNRPHEETKSHSLKDKPRDGGRSR